MKSHFTSKFFTGNRAQLRESCGEQLIVVTANGRLQRGADNAFGFAQDANFWYLTGIDEPDVVLVMDGGEEYLVLPKQNNYQKVFDGVTPEKGLARRSGVKQVYGNREGWQRLRKRLKKTRYVATIAAPPAYVEQYGIYANPARATLVKELKSCRRDLKVSDTAKQLVQLRTVKQPEEIAAIRAAVDITTASLDDALGNQYRHEYELEAAVVAGFRRRGATGHAFEPIVAAGKRACTLHNTANNGVIGSGALVVVDVGAEVEHYAADVTRTVSFGRLSARQRAVHDAVLEAQKCAIRLLKPGLALKDYRERTDRFIGAKLRELGLIKNVNARNIRKYCPHAISHFLGLNVHDAADYSRPLQAGMVLTVEPGIYIPEEEIGVRIEDDVLITEKGYVTLSGKLPRRLG